MIFSSKSNTAVGSRFMRQHDHCFIAQPTCAVLLNPEGLFGFSLGFSIKPTKRSVQPIRTAKIDQLVLLFLSALELFWEPFVASKNWAIDRIPGCA